jgi:hypothetical protein
MTECPLTPDPSPARGEGSEIWGSDLPLLPSPLAGEGLGVRGSILPASQNRGF